MARDERTWKLGKTTRLDERMEREGKIKLLTNPKKYEIILK
jgi:hypothetical protein